MAAFKVFTDPDSGDYYIETPDGEQTEEYGSDDVAMFEYAGKPYVCVGEDTISPRASIIPGSVYGLQLYQTEKAVWEAEEGEGVVEGVEEVVEEGPADEQEDYGADSELGEDEEDGEEPGEENDEDEDDDPEED